MNGVLGKNEFEKIISPEVQYDVIDYYMNIKLPIKIFLKLCQDMLTDQENLKIKLFIEKYFEQPGYNPKFKTWIKITTNQIIKGEILTPETQDIILDFMEKNKIPSNFFIICLMKYRNNELNIEKQKVKSL